MLGKIWKSNLDSINLTKSQTKPSNMKTSQPISGFRWKHTSDLISYPVNKEIQEISGMMIKRAWWTHLLEWRNALFRENVVIWWYQRLCRALIDVNLDGWWWFSTPNDTNTNQKLENLISIIFPCTFILQSSKQTTMEVKNLKAIIHRPFYDGILCCGNTKLPEPKERNLQTLGKIMNDE